SVLRRGADSGSARRHSRLTGKARQGGGNNHERPAAGDFAGADRRRAAGESWWLAYRVLGGERTDGRDGACPVARAAKGE
ncbi:hypothetical protein OC498_15910, partial [Acinetobacter bohemicus]